MPKRPEKLISWYPARNCWRKKYKGRTYYLATKGQCQGEHDQEGYLAAIAEWREIKRRVDGGQAAPATEPVAAQRATVQASALGQFGLPVKLPSPFVSSFAYDYSSEPDDLPGVEYSNPANATLNEAIDGFVDEFRERAKLQDCAVTTYREAHDNMADFKGYAEKYKRTKVEDVSEHLLKCYRDKQRELVQKGEMSAYTAKKRLSYLKRFIEWAYKHRYLENMPRNVDRHFARVVKLPDPAPKPFALEEVKALWTTATTKGKFSRKNYRNALYLLLGLNCGYRAGDIATLRHSYLRQENGVWIIDRKRQKTGSPQVHKLWPITLNLLQEEMTDPDEHEVMLLDERGGLLLVESLDAKTRVNDCIGRCHNRLLAKLKWTGGGKGHSVLRDTGADMIKKQFPATPHIVSQYLGHKPTGMHTHYAREHYDLLFQALDWLNDHLALKL